MREEDELSTKTTPRCKKPTEEDSSSVNTGRVTRLTDSSSHSPSRIYTRRMIPLDGRSVSSINRANIHLPSCYWTVQEANHIQSCSLNQPIAFKVEV